MKACILCIGEEVLNGKVINTNAAFISRELDKIGIRTERTVVIGDDPKMIEAELSLFKNSDAEILVTTGGLGPTRDDITKEVIFRSLGLVTERKSEALKHLEDYFGKEYPLCNERQVLFPKEAFILENKLGTANGAIIRQQEKTYIILVGPPVELVPMVKDSVRPYLLKETGESDSVVDFLVMGKGESEFEEYLSSFFNKYPKIKIASYPGGGQIRYEIRSNPQDRDEYQLALLDFRNLMAEYIISDNGEGIEEVIIKLLKKKQWRISICESCTGGMLSSMLVNVPGASKVFEEGFITYSNNSKMKYLGVKEETIREHGVVSSPVVLEMIEGLKKLNQADVLIGVSGIAGPGGGSLRKPVGLVHYGIMVKNESISEAKVFKGNREQIRKKACLWILYRLFLLIKDR